MGDGDTPTYPGGMSNPGRPVPLTCPPEYAGRCARCHAVCHRYGPGGNPLCASCRDEVRALRGGKY
jgi:hypothetical protein